MPVPAQPPEDVAIARSEPAPTVPELDGRARGRIRAEIWIVLGLSLGRSAVYAVVQLVDRLTAGPPLAQQTATLNASQSARPWLDLTYQLLSIGFALVPVALALYLLAAPEGLRVTLRRIGLDAARPGRDLLAGLGLAAAIGLPGLGLYAVGRALGLSVHIATSGLSGIWWTVPVLVLSALKNAVVEEVVVVAFLMERLRTLRWATPAVLLTSALLRGTYHLYQGPAMAAGNVVMGLLLGWYYLRRRRVMPLVVAHTVLDIVSFVGYALIPASLLASLGLS